MKMDINRMLNHFSEVSVFNRSVPALFLILGLSLAFTLLYTLEELKGRGGPLWRNFGAVVEAWIPDWFGFPVFFVILTRALWLVAMAAITGSLLTYAVPPEWATEEKGAATAKAQPQPEIAIQKIFNLKVC